MVDSGVTRGGGRSAPRDTIQPPRGDTRMKLFFMAEFRKNTGQTTAEGLGVVTRRQLKKVITSQQRAI